MPILRFTRHLQKKAWLFFTLKARAVGFESQPGRRRQCTFVTRFTFYLGQKGGDSLRRDGGWNKTHGDSMYYFKAGLKLAERYSVDTSDVSGFDFPGWAPPKPRGMHQSTYDRFLVRLSRYQILYGKQLARDIAEILRRLD